MSTLDQAFIKVYRKETEHWLAQQATPARQPMPAHPPGAPVGLDAAHGHVPSPHARFAPAPTPAPQVIAPPPIVPPAYLASTQYAAPHVSPPYAMPLGQVTTHIHAPRTVAHGATHLNPPHFARSLPTTPPIDPVSPAAVVFDEATDEIAVEHERVQPAYEVARLQWPSLVEQWVAHAGSGLVRCAAELARRNYQQRKVLLVTSYQRGTGVSHVALCLARVAASAGLRVVLVDAHFRQPQLADLLALAPTVGWSEVLRGEQPLSEALVDSPSEQVTVLPLADGKAAPADMALAPATITELRESYDLVLLDGGAIDTDAAAKKLTGLFPLRPNEGKRPDCDALVVRDMSDPTASLEHVARRLRLAGIVRWDLVDNFLGAIGE
ncbi:MAG: hypothetical protein JSS27_11140 [Planctomycetes bacterium]|nr:hypothetical protein [Planctomycetota bacterium]